MLSAERICAGAFALAAEVHDPPANAGVIGGPSGVGALALHDFAFWLCPFHVRSPSNISGYWTASAAFISSAIRSTMRSSFSMRLAALAIVARFQALRSGKASRKADSSFVGILPWTQAYARLGLTRAFGLTHLCDFEKNAEFASKGLAFLFFMLRANVGSHWPVMPPKASPQWVLESS